MTCAPMTACCHAGRLQLDPSTLGTRPLLDPWAIGATALIPCGGHSARGAAAAAETPLTRRSSPPPTGVFRKILNAGRAPSPCRGCDMRSRRARNCPEALRARWQGRLTGTTIHEALGMSECSTFPSLRQPRPPRAEGTLGGHPAAGPLHRDPVRRRPPRPHRARPAILAHPPLRPRPDAGISHRGHPGGEKTCRSAATGFLTGDLVSADPDGALALPWPP